MRKFFIYCSLFAITGMLLWTNAWTEEPKVITIEALAIEMSQNVLNEFVSPGPSETKGFISPDRIDADKIVQSLESLVKDKKVSLATNPIKVNAIEGKKASIAISVDIFYMEKVDKDTFKLKKLIGKKGAGTFFEATPTITEDGRISVQYKLLLRTVMERAPIEGDKSLNIGYPLFSVRESASSVILNDGQPMALGGSTVGGQCFLVILTAKSK